MDLLIQLQLISGQPSGHGHQVGAIGGMPTHPRAKLDFDSLPKNPNGVFIALREIYDMAYETNVSNIKINYVEIIRFEYLHKI